MINRIMGCLAAAVLVAAPEVMALNANVGDTTCAAQEDLSAGQAEVFSFVLRQGTTKLAAPDICFVIDGIANCGGSQSSTGSW